MHFSNLHNSAEIYLNRANAKGNSGQYEEALVDYTEAIGINSNLAEAYANRGKTKSDLDRIGEARSDFQKALELAEQQGNAEFKTAMQKRLQELNNSTP